MGGRGASAGNSNVTPSRTKMYVKQTQNNDFYKNKYVKIDGKEVITDGFSIYSLNNAGIKEEGGVQLKEFIKGQFKILESDMKGQKVTYNSLNSLMNKPTTVSNYGVKAIKTQDENYGFDLKRVKQARTILGKNTEYAYVKTGAYSSMIFRNKKGETGFLLPLRLKR